MTRAVGALLIVKKTLPKFLYTNSKDTYNKYRDDQVYNGWFRDYYPYNFGGLL